MTVHLAPRAEEVLELLVRGRTRAEIARVLSLSPHTVRGHVQALLAAHGVHAQGALIARVWADRHGAVVDQLAECQRVLAILDRRGRYEATPGTSEGVPPPGFANQARFDAAREHDASSLGKGPN